MFSRWIDAIERAGNRLPDPVTLFLWLIAFTLILSAILAWAGVGAAHPASGDQILVRNLFSAEILRRFLVEMPQTFAGFPPLGTVLTAMLGIGVAEKSGLISAALRQSVSRLPRSALSVAVVFVGILSSLAADAGYVVLIPLGALVFYNAGRHPLAGLAATFAGVSAGYSANLVLTSLDPLLAGFTQSSAQLLDPAYQVGPAANYYLMVALVPVISIAGALVTDRFIEPRLGPWTGTKVVDGRPPDLSVDEKRGLWWAGATVLLFAMLIAALVIPEQGVLRDDQGTISPFLNSLVALMLLVFLIPGLVFGVVTGGIRSDREAVQMTADSMSDMGLYIVLAFVAAHFLAFFSWSNLGIVTAIGGAGFLQSLNFSGVPLIVSFILVAALINIFIGSASAKWALLAPVFVPMLMLMGYSPELTQAAYRIGDSFTNVLTPLLPYFPLILIFGRRYVPDFGVGNLIALMVPYSIFIGLVSISTLVIWMLLGLPLGPGAPLTASLN